MPSHSVSCRFIGRVTLSCALLGIAALLPSSSVIHGRQATSASSARTMELTTSSERAKAHFREAVFETQNVAVERARLAIAEAVKADPSFALARAYQAFLQAGDAPERERAIAAVLPEMKTASVPETLFLLYLRESLAGRGPAAIPVLRAVAELTPGDADMAWFYVNAARSGKPTDAQLELVKNHVARFPAHAASRNQFAYILYGAGDTAGALRQVEEYLRLAPNHPNAHDSMADMLLLEKKPKEALNHVQRELELAPNLPQALEKIGAISLMSGDPNKARADFARAIQLVPSTKYVCMYWTAATYAHSGDGKAALRELASTRSAAESENLPAQARNAQGVMAIVEAYLGDPKKVAGNLASAASPAPTAPEHAFRAILLARIGDIAEARKAAERYADMVGAGNTFTHTLNAIVATQAKDLATAEKELALAPRQHLLTKAIRADYLMRTGQSAEAAKLVDDVMTSSIKQDGNPSVDYFKLIARMHAAQLARGTT